MVSEVDTRTKLVDPKLHEAGWKDGMIRKGSRIALSRIVDDRGNCKKDTEKDYTLYVSSFPIAVVKAEPESKSFLSEMQQVKDNAKNYMNVLSAYSTNCHKIEESDFTTNRQKTVEKYPSSEELREEYVNYKLKGVITKLRANLPEALYYYIPRGNRPWHFQEVGIRRNIEEIIKGRMLLLLTLATGKIPVSFQVVCKLVKLGYFRYILYLADRLFLIDQAIAQAVLRKAFYGSDRNGK